jgi:exodeoxyribonuclease V
LAHIRLLVVDECSMLDAMLATHLLGFGFPILAIGDPFQLPPVFGPGYFMQQEPDVFLKQIHRQAEDNPILRLPPTFDKASGCHVQAIGLAKR